MGAGRASQGSSVKKSDLVEHVAKETGVSKSSAAAAISAVFGGIEKALKKGERVRLVGFGGFSVSRRAARKARNPATGEEVNIPASQAVRFRASIGLKETINKKSAAAAAKKKA